MNKKTDEKTGMSKKMREESEPPMRLRASVVAPIQFVKPVTFASTPGSDASEI